METATRQTRLWARVRRHCIMHDHSQHLPVDQPSIWNRGTIQAHLHTCLLKLTSVVVLAGKLDFDAFASIFKAPSQVRVLTPEKQCACHNARLLDATYQMPCSCGIVAHTGIGGHAPQLAVTQLEPCMLPACDDEVPAHRDPCTPSTRPLLPSLPTPTQPCTPPPHLSRMRRALAAAWAGRRATRARCWRRCASPAGSCSPTTSTSRSHTPVGGRWAAGGGGGRVGKAEG
jgi:hypothetical protein